MAKAEADVRAVVAAGAVVGSGTSGPLRMQTTDKEIGSRMASTKSYRAPKGSMPSQFLAIAMLAFSILGLRALGVEPTDQKAFESPAAAVTALVDAAKTDDTNALGSILGSDANDLISSGDQVADNNAREKFVAKYGQMHRLAYDPEDQVILYIGADNWSFPIPLVQHGKGWVFESTAGKAELLYRRIGRNELYTIGVLRILADSQWEYANRLRQGGDIAQFAQKIRSTSGKRNGLYWPVAAGEPESPIGPLIAAAVAEGYQTVTGTPVPFHGYYYNILTRQGSNAPRGAMSYIVDGRMTRGFAFLAYPATYRASGVMTFMVNQDNVIVQKDLGPETTKIASSIREFNPDHSWDQDVFNSESDGAY